ncbi:PEGA domain-containing protein [Ornithobacterium rhinotracheale]|uniref:PEGA domain-containing protein n=1 Tax=Ornithobacterium rhinotracheale TaxID=28251 RepID=UPI00129D18B9|nr:PEGA domain-containing protein [Ornithobacterium rhinotracheale]MRJ07441.1 PEGA domain-containing protein [Ornithobacterium rhinotracheale]UOH78038.1 PEGA domain-containing protein [Ornithobacterium rhinotracheale]
MKRTKLYACGLLVILSLSSCATIFTGTSDRITFNSTPEGATVYERGIEKCKTPCTLKVTRTLSEKDIEFKKDEYQNRTIELDAKFNPVSIINLTNGIGWIIDAFSGSIKKYDTKVYNIELEPKK